QERWASPLVVLRGIAVGVAIAFWQAIDSRGPVWAAAHWASATVVLGSMALVTRYVLLQLVLVLRTYTKSGDRVILVGDPNVVGDREAAEAVLSRPGVQSVGWLSEQVHVDEYLGHPSAVW